MLELGYDLPDEVFYHPTVVALRRMSCDLIIMDNVKLPTFVFRAAAVLINFGLQTLYHTTRSRLSRSIPIT